jgi:antitoxin VapB
VPEPEALAGLRLPLTPQEADRLASLGPECAEALEGALRDWRPSERECDLAARIAAALEERRLLASLILVGGARRRRAFRHPIPTDAVTGQDALAIIVGIRGGLNVSCSRTVCAGAPHADLEARHRAACAVEAAMIAATRPGRSWESVVDVAKVAYAEAGYPDEWRAHFQGGPVGYLSREFDVVPGTASAATLITLGAGFAWNPTVQGGKSEDTFIVGEDGARSVSNTDAWPSMTIDTQLGPLRRPAILEL